MTDMSLRLPTTHFRAVFDLGQRPAAQTPLPTALGKPNLYAEYDDDDLITALYVGYETGQVHLETTPSGDVEHHFHLANGDDSDLSPFGVADTRVLVEWSTRLIVDLHRRMPDLLDEVDEAAAWHDAGFDLYVCEVEEPRKLDLVEVDIEGELLTLPWLGSGAVEHDHIEGDDHPIALTWTPQGASEGVPIAEAWLDPRTDQPRTKALPGVDWEAVGWGRDEVLPWLEAIYMNHHVLPDAAGTILTGVLERLGGIDGTD
ncbi:MULTISPECIES: hypothetical protein [unclassified Frigoribacterium]|uniref:hypothetical protein n=1 Tax=Frigoribacterium sp. Leaf8 TaxID=1735673 RepID=UPI000701618C|nr:hypothetical protein [Frigoribacterium sp. Leaf8]KQM25860.1 hypothetical protein ASL10_10440 [Frigoribacterium sp. Leaf8]